MTRLYCTKHRPLVAKTHQKSPSHRPVPARVAEGAVASQPVYVAVAAMPDGQGRGTNECRASAAATVGAPVHTSHRLRRTSADSIRCVHRRPVDAPRARHGLLSGTTVS